MKLVNDTLGHSFGDSIIMAIANIIGTLFQDIGFVDTFDAMTNDRPYRKALSAEAAIGEIVHCAGTQFDSQQVDIFISLAHQFLYNNKEKRGGNPR